VIEREEVGVAGRVANSGTEDEERVEAADQNKGEARASG